MWVFNKIVGEMFDEQVIIVDQKDNEVGVSEKLEAHRKGLLHRAFSILIFNSHNQILLQKRAASKYHSGGLLANACCSHPRPGEFLDDAIHRRLIEEMGFDCSLKPVFTFLYKTKLANDLFEHELDHVFIGTYDGPVAPNPEEVDDYRWVSWEQLANEMEKTPENYAFWFHEIVKAMHERRFMSKKA